jgi:tetratricopeptide (TPR) repeat protein
MNQLTQTASVSDALVEFMAGLEALPSSNKLSSQEAEGLYAFAYNAVSLGHYEEALNYFSLLTFYKPTVPRYIKGLALSYKLLERFDEALNMYTLLSLIEPADMAHTLAVAECQLQTSATEAQQTLAWVIEACADGGGDERLLARAQALHKLISQETETA